jgi:hypothetical protein
VSHRLVVLLCGPPGAGKTTSARTSGLTVYDRDDPHWTGERDFRAALAALAGDRHAQAVVIRTGASSTARAKAAQLIDATHVYLLLADQAELGRRIAHRHRDDTRHALAGIGKWFATHDRADGVALFPGWEHVMATSGSTTDRGYGTEHQLERERWTPIVEAGQAECAAVVCLEPTRAIAPGSDWHLDHDDDRTGYRGPAHARCNTSAGGRNGAAVTNAARTMTVREWGTA